MVQSGETKGDGLASIPVLTDYPHVIVAEKDNDVVFVNDVKTFVDAPENVILWHVFDDRHMYRPKETVMTFSLSFLMLISCLLAPH